MTKTALPYAGNGCRVVGDERIGRAVRSPPHDLLSQTASQIGIGFGFGFLHEALDQIGAVSGLLAVVAILAGLSWRIK